MFFAPTNHSIRIVAACVLITLIADSGARPLSAQDQAQIKLSPDAVEDFTFTERSGRTVTRADLLGRPWLACFIFTRCASTCPKVTGAMAELSRTLKGTDVQFVSITVDPGHDSLEVLQNYADLFQADPDRWWFLSGDKAATFHLIHNSFNMPAAENPKGPPGFEVIHSNNIMHVAADGHVLGKYNAIVDDEMAVLRRVIRKGIETPTKHRFIKKTPGIRIGNEPLAAERATTAPPEEEKSLPNWVTKLPTVNACLNGLSTLLLLVGYGLIRRKKITAHRNVMLAAFGVSIAFLACYLIYHGYAGSKPFEGTGPIRPVYFTTLISHIILAVFVPGMAAATIYRGLKGQTDRHRRIAKWTFPIWLYVSVTGVIIYLMLYHWPK